MVKCPTTGRTDPRRCRWIARAMAAALTIIAPWTGASGCADPSANILVVWVERAGSPDGTRSLEVYDDGDRFTVPVQPAVVGSSTELLRLQVDDRARGVAISGMQETVYQGLRDHRRARVGRGLAEGRELAAAFSYVRNADAILRQFAGGGPPAWAFMPVTSEYAGESSVLSPPSPDRDFLLYSATDAAMMFWVELTVVAGEPSRADGLVQAIAYPSDVAGAGPIVTAPTNIAVGELHGRGFNRAEFPARVVDDYCNNYVCVSPDGRSLTTPGGAACSIWWWAWEDGRSPQEEVQPRFVELPQECVEDEDPHLFAQLAHDVVALDDDERYYVFDLSAGTMQAVPKLSSPSLWFLRERGRAFVIVSASGQVISLRPEGPELLNTEQTFCANPRAQVSPNGRWILQTCTGDGTVTPTSTAFILRISTLGLERFQGIPMQPLGIDDRGNALMFSFDPDSSSGTPRGLFVLTGDGHVARVDDLEPEPDPASAASQEVQIWFSARPIPSENAAPIDR